MSMRDGARWAVMVMCLVLLAATVFPVAAQKKPGKKAGGAAAPAATAEGIAVYQKNSCGACHAIGGKGGKSGTDLSHIGKTMKAAQISKYIRAPKSVNAKSKMPAYPASKIGDKELKALTAYLAGLK